MASRFVFLTGVLLLVFLASCGQGPTLVPTPIPTLIPTSAPAPTSTPTLEAPTATPKPTASPTAPPPTATAQPTATPTPTSPPIPSPTPTPTPRPLTSVEVYDMVSPSVVFIDTPSGTGSGFVIEGGFVVTNVHVTWPWDFVRVVFPDGSELSNVQVVSTDWLTDFAILGPVVTNALEIELIDGEELPVGSEVYLIGYPAETEVNPQPSITRGIISRFREWDFADVTFIQTDAAITGGQSGGVLVSANAEVIGISGFSFSDADFGLVASAKDIEPRIEAILEGSEIPFGNLYNPIPSEGGQSEILLSLQGYQGKTYVVEQTGTETDLTVRVEGDNDAVLVITDALGNVYEIVDETASGSETFSGTVSLDRPVYVTVGQQHDFEGAFNLSSNLVLIPWPDPDDGRIIEVGFADAGNIDHAFDADQWFVELEGQKTYVIAVDSAQMDPFLIVDLPDGATEQLVDDDSLGGLWGLGAYISYVAPVDGFYRLTIRDSESENIGGYVLRIVESD